MMDFGSIRTTVGPDDLSSLFQPKWFYGSLSVKDGPSSEAAELNILKKCSKTHHSSSRKQTSMLRLSAHRISYGYVEINFRCENLGAEHWL